MRVRWSNVIGLAAIAKGLSSAGFGPVLTSGELMIGVPEGSAVAITSAAEAPVAAAALVAFGSLEAWPGVPLSATLILGGLVGVPAAVSTVRPVLPMRAIRIAVALMAIVLGGLAVLAVMVDGRA